MSTNVPLTAALAPHDLELLRRLGEAAYSRDVQLWTVGGAVRDALLGLPVLDVDLTSETPAEDLGPALARDLGGSVIAHSQFGTVKLRFSERTVDLATARSERYVRPGALPTVGPGSMADDLARRDFSINAMAASLAPNSFGALLDTQGGLEDLRSKALRVLHERSFQDDATRIVRAARYAVRLGFRMEARTRRWLRRDLSYLDTISPARMRRELERVLEEENAVSPLQEMHRLGVLGAMHPGLGLPGVRTSLRRAADKTLSPLAVLGVLVYAVPASELGNLSKRLALTVRESAVVESVAQLRAAETRMAEATLGDVDALAGTVPEAAVEACAAVSASSQVRRKLAHYLEKMRDFRPLLDGNDIIALGIPPGPEVGRLLRSLREATLEGIIRSRQGAVTFIGKVLEESRR